MIGRNIAIAALTGAFVLTPAVAMAEVYPAPPPEATLQGSLLSPVCDADVPYLNYNITVIDPGKKVDPAITTATITFINPDGPNWSTSVPLYSGRILWPGASVDASGVADGWPGWALDPATGEFVDVGDDNFGWTRDPGTQVTVQVNPEMTFAVSYPPATAECATDPTEDVSPISKTAAAVPTLSTTGFESMPLALGAGALLIAGAATVIVAARRTSSGIKA